MVKAFWNLSCTKLSCTFLLSCTFITRLYQLWMQAGSSWCLKNSSYQPIKCKYWLNLCIVSWTIGVISSHSNPLPDDLSPETFCQQYISPGSTSFNDNINNFNGFVTQQWCYRITCKHIKNTLSQPVTLPHWWSDNSLFQPAISRVLLQIHWSKYIWRQLNVA